MAALAPDIASVEAAILVLTNAARLEAHAGPLTQNPQLASAARAYAALLAASGRFAHDADGSIDARATRAGYKPCAVAENLALRRGAGYGVETLARSTLDGWLKSPIHHANLVSAAMTEGGVGVAAVQKPGAAPAYIAVELFGRPQSAGLTFRVQNVSGAGVTFWFAGKLHALASHSTLKLSACAAGPVTFEKSATQAISARYDASDGAMFVISGAAGGAVRVEVKR